MKLTLIIIIHNVLILIKKANGVNKIILGSENSQ